MELFKKFLNAARELRCCSAFALVKKSSTLRSLELITKNKTPNESGAKLIPKVPLKAAVGHAHEVESKPAHPQLQHNVLFNVDKALQS